MGLQMGPSLVFTRELILREGLCQCYECGFDFMLHFFFLIIEVNMIYNVVLVSGVQQSDSVICACIFCFQILFPSRHSSQCCIFYVDPEFIGFLAFPCVI